jgi:hypothetical protein
MERHRTADRLRDRAQFVDAVAMIAVRVGHDDPVELADASGEQLLPEIRTAIDEHALAGTLGKN